MQLAEGQRTVGMADGITVDNRAVAPARISHVLPILSYMMRWQPAGQLLPLGVTHCLSADTGLRRTARSAGARLATTATTTRSMATDVYVSGSSVLTP